MQFVATNLAWDGRIVTSEIYVKNGTFIAVPTVRFNRYVCFSLSFSETTPAPSCGQWTGLPVGPYDVEWYQSKVGTTADGVEVWAWNMGYGTTESINPDEWADDILSADDTIGDWISRHTKAQIEDLQNAKSIKVDLYINNDRQPTLTVHWENGSQHPLDFHEKWLPMGHTLTATERATAYGKFKQFTGGSAVKKENVYNSVLNDGGSYRTWLDLDGELWRPLTRTQKMAINLASLNFNTTPDYYFFVFKATRDVIIEGVQTKQSSKRIVCAIPVNTPATASQIDYDIRYVAEDDTDMMFDVSLTIHIDESIPSEYQDDINLTDREGDENYDNDNKGKNDTKDTGAEDGAGIDTTGMLTTTYALTKEQCRILGQKVWSQSYFDVLKVQTDPIQNIVSVKAFPFSITGGADAEIKIGDVLMDCRGNKLSSNWVPIEAGEITVNNIYGNFLDYSPYTTASIYIPYSGIHSLDTSMIMGETLKFDYIVDLVTGACRCRIKIGTTIINEFDCTMGVDIPLSSTDRAQSDAKHLSSIAGGIMFGARAGVVSGAMGGLSGVLNAVGDGYHTSHTSGGSPTVSSHDNDRIMVILDYPTPASAKYYNETYGKMCRKSFRLGELGGYTEVSNIKLDDIPMTEDEEQDLLQVLRSGFYSVVEK